MILGRIFEKALGIKTVPMDVEQLTDMIDRCFIQGADEKQRSDIRVAIKGSLFRVTLYNKNGYELRVSEYNFRCSPLNARTVWIHEKESDTYYELAKGWHFWKLRNAVYARLDQVG